MPPSGDYKLIVSSKYKHIMLSRYKPVVSLIYKPIVLYKCKPIANNYYYVFYKQCLERNTFGGTDSQEPCEF